MKVLSSKISLLFFLIVLISIISFLLKETYQQQEVKEEVRQLNKEIKELQEENKDMASLKASLNNPSFIERQARQKLNLRKPGETVVIPIKGQVSSEIIVEEKKEEPTPSKPISNPTKWWRYLFN